MATIPGGEVEEKKLRDRSITWVFFLTVKKKIGILLHSYTYKETIC